MLRRCWTRSAHRKGVHRGVGRVCRGREPTRPGLNLHFVAALFAVPRRDGEYDPAGPQGIAAYRPLALDSKGSAGGARWGRRFSRFLKNPRFAHRSTDREFIRLHYAALKASPVKERALTN